MAGSTLMRQLLRGKGGELTENGLVEGEGTRKMSLDDFVSKVMVKYPLGLNSLFNLFYFIF